MVHGGPKKGGLVNITTLVSPNGNSGGADLRRIHPNLMLFQSESQYKNLIFGQR